MRAAVFPLDLPGPTAVYVCLYVLTLAVHVVFMSYVLAGSGFVAACAMLGRARPSPAARVIRDWLPFGLGATITAGVAPLLFVQILYKESFYTANLLLFHRWMAIVPVLIVGFYLLYLAKSKAMERWSKAATIAISTGAFACFAFTAYSWTENHLLALDHGEWVDFYASGRILYQSPQLLPRVAMWLSGTLPVMAVIAAWQLWQTTDARASTAEAASTVRHLAIMALSGLVTSGAFALWYAGTLDELARPALMSRAARLYLGVAASGMAMQALAWALLWRQRGLSPRPLIVASTGAFLAVIGTATAREIMRLGMLEPGSLFALHARVAGAGGLPVFAAFLVINIGVIAWCFHITRKGLQDQNG